MGLAPPSSHGPLLAVTRDLTSTEIATLYSAPITLVPAMGAGVALIPVAGSFQYKPGTTAFVQDAYCYAFTPGGYGIGCNMHFDNLTPYVGQLQNIDTFQFSVANTGLVLQLSRDPGELGGIATSSLNAGGDSWLVGDTATVAGGTGGTITVSTIANSFAISAVNQGTMTFTVVGDASAFQLNDTLLVYRSTGNDGSYAITSAVFAAGHTAIVVQSAIPSAVANGHAGDEAIGGPGAIVTYTVSAAGSGYEVESGAALTAVSPSLGENATIDILTVTAGSDGTGRATVLYYPMVLR